MAWLVPGIHAVPTKSQTSTEFIKQHVNPKQFEIESRLLEIARGAGCAPQFTIESPMTIRLRLHQRLGDWLATSTPNGRLAMARRVLAQVRRLHAAGVCHRDLKPDDVVVDGDEPLLIDFELGAEVDPNGGCYDIVGPDASRVPLPLVHAVIGLRHGVWWDSETPMVRPMWHEFGRVSEIEASL